MIVLKNIKKQQMCVNISPSNNLQRHISSSVLTEVAHLKVSFDVSDH